MPCRVPSSGVNQINILRADHNVNRLIVSKALVHTGESGTEDLNQLIMDHDARYNVALTDEVGHEGIFRLIVDLLRGTHLLDIALVHDYDGIRHGQCLFLVVGNIDKGDAQLIFQADQLILHVLAQLQVQSA